METDICGFVLMAWFSYTIFLLLQASLWFSYHHVKPFVGPHCSLYSHLEWILLSLWLYIMVIWFWSDFCFDYFKPESMHEYNMAPRSFMLLFPSGLRRNLSFMFWITCLRLSYPRICMLSFHQCFLYCQLQQS